MDYPSRDFNSDRRVSQKFTEVLRDMMQEHEPVVADAEVVRWLEARQTQNREQQADRLYLKSLGIAPL